MALTLLFLAGCATIGNPALTDEAAAQIVVGETTREQVLALFGEPQTVTTSQDATGVVTEVWGYSYAQSSLVAGTTARSLVVVFGADGLVRHVSRSRIGP